MLKHLKETELCLGLPGGSSTDGETLKISGKRGFSETVDFKLNLIHPTDDHDHMPMDLNNNSSPNQININLEKDNSVTKPPAK